MQCSQFVFGCIYVSVTLQLWGRSFWGLVPTLLATCDQEAIDVCKNQNGAGVVQVWLCYREWYNGNKGRLHQKRVRQRRKSLTDWRRSDVSYTGRVWWRQVGQMFGDSHNTSLTSWNSSDDCFAIFTAIPRLAPTRYTWLQQISTYIFPDILLREAYSAHAYS